MSIILSSNEILQMRTSDASTVRVTATYVDIGTSVTGSAQQSTTSVAETTTILSAPGADAKRCLKQLSITNGATTQSIMVMASSSLGTYDMYSARLAASRSIMWTEGLGWQKNDEGYAFPQQLPRNSDVQRYTTPGTYTWTKPTWFTTHSVYVIMWGGGGGGGGGYSSSGDRVGGAGGGGGAYNHHLFRASELTSTVTVTVGAGGGGGAGGNSASAPKTGSAGGVSSFGTYMSAYGGGGGARGASGLSSYPEGGGGGGTMSSGSTGIVNVTPGQATPGGYPAGQGQSRRGWGTGDGYQSISTAYFTEFGGAGGCGGSLTSVSHGAQSMWAGGGGGGGGQRDSAASVSYEGGNGGVADGRVTMSAGGGLGAPGGSVGSPPTAAGNGADGAYGHGGGGGGGGGLETTAGTNGPVGGNGGARGGGGGGGGAASAGSPTVGGTGGTGGRGEVIVITW